MGETLYDVLGIGPRATVEQVERAYRHALGLYDEDSLATYSLFTPEERKIHKQRVQEAYEVLRDPVRRSEYDEVQRLAGGLGAARAAAHAAPAGGEPPPAAAPKPDHTAPPPSVLPEPVCGSALREARERSGVSLRDIAAASKVGVRYLEYIEGDRFDRLPAPVYLRGFVQEYARSIHLDPRRTAESYLAYVAGREGQK